MNQQAGRSSNIISEFIESYFERRMARILLLGMISGFPWVLIASSLSLWLKEEGLSRSAIGWAGLISKPPVVDLYPRSVCWPW